MLYFLRETEELFCFIPPRSGTCCSWECAFEVLISSVSSLRSRFFILQYCVIRICYTWGTPKPCPDRKWEEIRLIVWVLGVVGFFFLFILIGFDFQCSAISCGLLDRKQRGSSTSFCIISCQTLHTREEEQWWFQAIRRKRREILWNKLCLECSKIQNNSLKNSELCEICSAGCCTFCFHLKTGCEMMNCWDVLTDTSQRDVFDRFFFLVMISVTLSSCLCFCVFVFIHLLFVSLSQQGPSYHNEIQEAEISLN